MATVARFRAVVSFKGIRVAGFIGWVMWAFVHITFLTGFKNRFTALFHWAVTFLGRSREERTITWQQISGRLVAMGIEPGAPDAGGNKPDA
jgi:NADH dehydrogenase